MPAEPTKAKLKRRTSRKDLEEYRFDGSHGRELELKRNRGSFCTDLLAHKATWHSADTFILLRRAGEVRSASI
jgi:hypothetical protein